MRSRRGGDKEPRRARTRPTGASARRSIRSSPNTSRTARSAWRHEAERLDGKPAPRFARDTYAAIRLTPEGAGTRVRLESRQGPAGFLRGIAVRLFAGREIARHFERSLERLAGAATAASEPGASSSAESGRPA